MIRVAVHREEIRPPDGEPIVVRPGMPMPEGVGLVPDGQVRVVPHPGREALGQRERRHPLRDAMKQGARRGLRVLALVTHVQPVNVPALPARSAAQASIAAHARRDRVLVLRALVRIGPTVATAQVMGAAVNGVAVPELIEAAKAAEELAP